MPNWLQYLCGQVSRDVEKDGIRLDFIRFLGGVFCDEYVRISLASHPKTTERDWWETTEFLPKRDEIAVWLCVQGSSCPTKL